MKNCLICNKDLDVHNQYDHRGPNSYDMLGDGIVFRSFGNYGSTVYDPMYGDEYLEIAICDECLKEKAAKILKINYTESKTVASKIVTLKEYMESDNEPTS